MSWWKNKPIIELSCGWRHMWGRFRVVWHHQALGRKIKKQFFSLKIARWKFTSLEPLIVLPVFMVKLSVIVIFSYTSSNMTLKKYFWKWRILLNHYKINLTNLPFQTACCVSYLTSLNRLQIKGTIIYFVSYRQGVNYVVFTNCWVC